MFLTQVFFLNIHVFLCALSCSLIPPRMSIKIFMLRAANWGMFGATGLHMARTRRTHWSVEICSAASVLNRGRHNEKSSPIGDWHKLRSQKLLVCDDCQKLIQFVWPFQLSAWSKVWLVVQLIRTHWIICLTIQQSCGKFMTHFTEMSLVPPALPFQLCRF